MKEFVDDINYEKAEEFEKLMRHDVMSHIHAFALQCPGRVMSVVVASAAPIV